MNASFILLVKKKYSKEAQFYLYIRLYTSNFRTDLKKKKKKKAHLKLTSNTPVFSSFIIQASIDVLMT